MEKNEEKIVSKGFEKQSRKDNVEFDSLADAKKARMDALKYGNCSQKLSDALATFADMYVVEDKNEDISFNVLYHTFLQHIAAETDSHFDINEYKPFDVLQWLCRRHSYDALEVQINDEPVFYEPTIKGIRFNTMGSILSVFATMTWTFKKGTYHDMKDLK